MHFNLNCVHHDAHHFITKSIGIRTSRQWLEYLSSPFMPSRFYSSPPPSKPLVLVLQNVPPHYDVVAYRNVDIHLF